MDKIQNLEGEIWKPVVGYEGKYEVSNKGRVKSLNFKNRGKCGLLKPSVNHAGYLRVTLAGGASRGSKRIHRIVYEAFVGPIPKYDPRTNGNNFYEINHIDEDKTNNSSSNLQLITHTENVRYGTGIKRKIKTQINGKNSKQVYQYTLKKEFVKIWPSLAELGRNEYAHKVICACCNNIYGKTKTNVFKGYIWSYTPLT